MKKLLSLLVLLPIAAVAEHRPEFQSLIDEPANMLDIAMLRIQDFTIWTEPFMAFEYQIAAERDKRRRMDINAAYREDDGVIQISASLMDLESTPAQTEAGCRRVLTMLRINISKGLHRLFSHVDGSYQPSANGQPADRRGMIKLSCHVYGRNSTDRRFGGEMSLEPDGEMEIREVR